MHKRKILLLENVATQAAGVREHLTQAGFQVAVSRYEADGLKRLVEWAPEVVLVSTSHPAGDFVEYCRRARALAPAVRIIVTSSLNRDRLFQEHPELQTIVDGVLLRPYSREEVAAMLAPAPAVPRAPAADPVIDPGNAQLRAEFQRQLDARFLEVEELKRHLEVASRRAAAAPGLEWLQSENDHLRQGVEEARKKAALALATEQLKRSEIEVKLDNLLRMKKDFEFRVQNEIDDRTQEIASMRGQLVELRERFDKEAGEHAALRVEMERALVEKERIEERLHALETGGPEGVAPPEAPPVADPRIAALAAELSHLRAQAAAGEVALADMTAKAAVLAESQAREQAAREEREQLLDQQAQSARAQGAESQRRAAELQSRHDGLQDRRAAAESSAAAAQTALLAANERRAELEQELADVRQALAGDARLAQEFRSEVTARTQEFVKRAASAEQRGEQLQAACAALEERLAASESARIAVAAEAAALHTRAADLGAAIASLRASRAEALSDTSVQGEERHGRELARAADRARELTTERDRLSGLLEERQQAGDREILVWREKAETAARELELHRSQQAQCAEERENAGRRSAERLKKALGDLEESERRGAAIRDDLATAMHAHEQETRLLTERAAAESAASRETCGRLEIADAALVAAREGIAARERELRLQLENRQASCRELEEKLAARSDAAVGASQVHAELHRIQELLEEVISRARTEAVDYARRDAELSSRLQAALDERRLLQERFDRANAEATERERRSSSLLQSAIDRGPAPTTERANLPAVVPLDPGPVTFRRRTALAGLAVVTLAVLLAAFGLRSGSPPAVREQQPAVPRPQPGVPPGVALTPREVWERWTRSDGSGGVLVQATLRSEAELRAEVEAESARGMSEENMRAELARRLSAFHFNATYYVTVYLKNLAPGYPAYLDDLPGRFRLRDGSGREVPAFVPPGHEKDRRIFSFGAGAPGDLIYEASVSLGFARAGLSPSAGYLQLVVLDVGAASRRVLTWELE